MPVKPYRVNLDPDDRAKLARLAGARDATVSALIRRAVREFLAREEGKGRTRKTK